MCWGRYLWLLWMCFCFDFHEITIPILTQPMTSLTLQLVKKKWISVLASLPPFRSPWVSLGIQLTPSMGHHSTNLIINYNAKCKAVFLTFTPGQSRKYLSGFAINITLQAVIIYFTSHRSFWCCAGLSSSTSTCCHVSYHLVNPLYIVVTVISVIFRIIITTNIVSSGDILNKYALFHVCSWHLQHCEIFNDAKTWEKTWSHDDRGSYALVFHHLLADWYITGM